MLASSVTVTSKNQITIPIDFIRKLNIKKGDKLSISENDGVVFMQKYDNLLDKYQNFLKIPINSQKRSLDEILKEVKKKRLTK